MRRPPSFPPVEAAITLHARLLADDITAGGEACTAFLPGLIAFLTKRFPREDPHWIHTAAGSALLDYVKRPATFDPRRCPDLGAYLRRAAEADLRNLRQREARHQRRRSVVELDRIAGNVSVEGGPALRLIREEESEQTRRIFDGIADGWDATDRAFLRLMRDGVKATAAFAAVMGIAHLPVGEQERLVKRARDRVVKRLQRGARRHA